MSLNSLIKFLFPTTCVMCGQRTEGDGSRVCPACLMHLPLTHYHTVEHNLLEKQFWGLFPIERATALFHHDGNHTRRIIYSTKYWGHPEVGEALAAEYTRQLLQSGFLDGVDCIVPLPLHWMRQLRRRYNQSHYIARGVRRVAGIPIYKDVVRRIRNNPSQTRCKSQERIKNVEGVFRLVRPEKIAGKHILLVDDVTTTGATIASCARTLALAPGTRISVLTLAVAGRTAVGASPSDEVDTSAFGVPLSE